MCSMVNTFLNRAKCVSKNKLKLRNKTNAIQKGQDIVYNIMGWFGRLGNAIVGGAQKIGPVAH
jgi:hypothetical protein